METIGIILLAIIAYMLWRIYRQKEEEKEQIADEKYYQDFFSKVDKGIFIQKENPIVKHVII